MNPKNLSKAERRRRFYRRLRDGSRDFEEIYAEACYYIEKILGQKITPEYPSSRFHVQLEEMKKDFQKQDREMKKSRSKRGTFR